MSLPYPYPDFLKFAASPCLAVSYPGGRIRIRASWDITLYKQIMESLMYLTTIRPEIMHSVSMISRNMENPKEIHLLVAKRIFHYVQGTKEFCLFYKKGEIACLVGFTDSDFVGDQDDRRSTLGAMFLC